jgi:hypothetical protein
MRAEKDANTNRGDRMPAGEESFLSPAARSLRVLENASTPKG